MSPVIIKTEKLLYNLIYNIDIQILWTIFFAASYLVVRNLKVLINACSSQSVHIAVIKIFSTRISLY